MKIEFMILIGVMALFGVVLVVQLLNNSKQTGNAKKPVDDVIRDTTWLFIGVATAVLLIYIIVSTTTRHIVDDSTAKPGYEAAAPKQEERSLALYR